MSSLCCCRGLLSLFGVRNYPLDVVAKAKLDRAKMSRAKQNDYATLSKQGAGERNGSVVSAQPALSEVSRDSSVRSKGRKPKRKPSSRSSRESAKGRRQRQSARSFDDSDSNSSADSEEESAKVLRKSIKRARSRDTLASLDKESRASTRSQDGLNIENERSPSPQSQSPRLQQSSARHSSRHRSPSSPGSPTSLRPRMASFHKADTEMFDEDAENEKFEESAKKEFAEEEPSGSPEEEGQRETITNPETGSQFEGVPEDEPRSKVRTTSGTPRDFRRKAIRGATSRGSPSLSMRSQQPPSPSASKWEVGEADSVYRIRDSDEEKPSFATEGAVGGPQRSPRGSITPSDDGDVSLRSVEPISNCGTLDVAVEYSMSEQKLQVTVLQAHDLPSKNRGGSSTVQVRAVLLPAKKKRYKTKTQHVSSPRFAETFKLTKASPEELKGLALRLRMYGIGTLIDKPIGETVIRFDELNLIRDPRLTLQLQLEPRADINRSESEASLAVENASKSMLSLAHGGSPPEILLSLSYNPPTGRLCVEVVKGSHFRNLAMSKPPDTLVKMSLLNSACQEMSQSKTTIRRGQPNPVYKETFFFQVAQFQLSEVTLMVSVYVKHTLKKKEMIGWVAMGLNSSSESEDQHWEEMKERKGQQVSRWHTLVDT